MDFINRIPGFGGEANYEDPFNESEVYADRFDKINWLARQTEAEGYAVLGPDLTDTATNQTPAASGPEAGATPFPLNMAVELGAHTGPVQATDATKEAPSPVPENDPELARRRVREALGEEPSA